MRPTIREHGSETARQREHLRPRDPIRTHRKGFRRARRAGARQGDDSAQRDQRALPFQLFAARDR